jgi:hypothetical protein
MGRSESSPASLTWRSAPRRCHLRLTRGPGHCQLRGVVRYLSHILGDFSEHYNHWHGYSTISGTVP